MLIVGLEESKIDGVEMIRIRCKALGRHSRLHVERWRSKQRYSGLYSAQIKNQRKCMQSDKRGRVRLFCIGGSWLRPHQEQDPWRCDRSADPMMQRKLCSFGRAGLDAPIGD
jgi:hypothetical protein